MVFLDFAETDATNCSTIAFPSLGNSDHVVVSVRVRQTAYVAFVCMPTFIGLRMILDMRTLTCMLIFSHSFFSYDFLKFSKFFWFLEFQTA